jgi:hypothetical protein
MELDDRALPLTRVQPDIWLARQTSYAGTGCQFGLFARVEGRVDADLCEQANCRALQEDKQLGVAFFEVGSQVSQKAVDYPGVELDTDSLSRSRHPVREACRSWGEDFLSLPPARASLCCVIRQFNGVNISDAGMPGLSRGLSASCSTTVRNRMYWGR